MVVPNASIIASKRLRSCAEREARSAASAASRATLCRRNACDAASLAEATSAE
eukprot:CAMPEP_0176298874 /NCGR_PEP_ID=MMETSP0121_2-20121125/59488_1 /TAXON_ID=160619 /ORGANISM="Kryptoperidinium foliaceum, Strain CCMP 1326" /LENGTH=52 /DNA_ID=CAMNT_0017640159 /DNA_START=18 /DNA_END=173 /DNA_ORIENTATION=-